MLLSAIRDAATQMSQEPRDDSASITADSVGEICASSRSVLKECMCADAWLDLEQCLGLAISSLKRCGKEASSSDELVLLSLLNMAKIAVGLVQAHLLWPTPVDPIVTARTKYQCLKNLVSSG